MKAFIVDDEINNIENLQFILEHDCSDITVVGTASSGADARKQLETLAVDVVFLDITMPEENGFEMLEKIKQPNFNIVFVTAHSEFALKAIKASAIDYILKPINISDLQNAVEKVRKNLASNSEQKNTNNELVANLLAQINGVSTDVKKITLSQAGKLVFVNIDDIVSIQADSNYAIVHNKSHEKFVCVKGLKDFEEMLPDTHFFRIHKSSIINLNEVNEILFADGGSVKMSDGAILSVSRRHIDDLLEKMKYKTFSSKH
jgi:two-component system, LytTR family, response regulator